MIDISILIVSYNTASLTISSIKSVIEQTTEKDYEIIVVDNNSSDSSADLIASTFPDILLIRLSENRGFATANNIAAEKAKGRYILLLNPDTVVLDHAIDKLIKFADKNTQFGIFGGSTYFSNMRRNPTSGWNKSSVWGMFCIAVGLARLFPKTKLFNPHSLANWRWNKPKQVDIVTGCFLLILRDNWNKLGGLNTDFFMYGEDVDLCLRARRANLSAIIVPDAKIIHYGGTSDFVVSEKLIKLYCSKTKLFSLHYKPVSAFALILMLKLLCLIRLFAFFVLSIIKPHYKKVFLEWKKIWNRREEWVRCKANNYV